jgi:DNA-binding CsgD family transcriptional regulator
MITELPHGDIVIISVEQYWDRGHIRGATLDTLNSLYPHLARGTMLAGRGDFERVRTSIETLSALGIPAVAVTPAAKVLLANAPFETSDHVWQTRGGEKLALHDPVAQSLVNTALSTITAIAGPRSIPVRRVPGGPVSGVLQVIPIRRAAHDVFGSASAIIVLSEAQQAGREATLLHSLFDLTAAELAVAQGIAGGLTVGQIARQNGRSVNTVRNQLSSVLQKTGCARQNELLILMNQLSGRVI